MALKLKAGQKYYRRDGAVTEPLLAVQGRGPLYDPLHGWSYETNGRLWANSQESKHDLVARYSPSDEAVDRVMEDLARVPLSAEECSLLEEYRYQGAAVTMPPKMADLVTECINELVDARKAFPAFNSLHEAMSVLREETDELWDEVKKKQLVPLIDAKYGLKGGLKKTANLERTKLARKEAIQVVAMALRLILDCCEPGSKSYGK
jgi:hypothetical protein